GGGAGESRPRHAEGAGDRCGRGDCPRAALAGRAPRVRGGQGTALLGRALPRRGGAPARGNATAVAPNLARRSTARALVELARGRPPRARCPPRLPPTRACAPRADGERRGGG